MTFGDEMERMKNALKSSPDTKDRYSRAGWGGCEWMAFSAWIAENRTRCSNESVCKYRDRLASWLSVTDVAYVLQFETACDVVNYLKDRLSKAADRETTKYRLSRRSGMIESGLWRIQESLDIRVQSGVHGVQFGGGMGSLTGCMHLSVLREAVAFLKGESRGASHWHHPDHKLHEEWYDGARRMEVPQELLNADREKARAEAADVEEAKSTAR